MKARLSYSVLILLLVLMSCRSSRYARAHQLSSFELGSLFEDPKEQGLTGSSATRVLFALLVGYALSFVV